MYLLPSMALDSANSWWNDALFSYSLYSQKAANFMEGMGCG